MRCAVAIASVGRALWRVGMARSLGLYQQCVYHAVNKYIIQLNGKIWLRTLTDVAMIQRIRLSYMVISLTASSRKHRVIHIDMHQQGRWRISVPDNHVRTFRADIKQ